MSAPENENLTADVKEIIEDLQKRGINTPVLLRFPQLLAGQIRKLQKAFKKAIKEFEYDGGHICVYPMKVNQNRAVIEEYLREGSSIISVSKPVPKPSFTRRSRMEHSKKVCSF